MFENSNNKFEVSDKKIVRLNQDSKDSSGNATETKDRAQELLDSLQKFMSKMDGESLFIWVIICTESRLYNGRKFCFT